MKYDIAIFDFDGTVLDTLEDIEWAVNTALEQNGMPVRSHEEVRAFVGDGARLLVDRAVPKGTPVHVTDKVFEDYRANYGPKGYPKTKPYDGVVDMLLKLKNNGISVAVLSNKPDRAVQEMCEQYFKGVFDYKAGERVGIPRKPEPDGVYKLLEEMNIPLERAVYVGDTDIDVTVARNAGMDCVAVDWGFRDREVLVAAGADVIASTPDELYGYLTQ